MTKKILELLLNEDSGSTAYDTSGNAFNGALTTSPAPTWVVDRNKRGLSFAGSGDKVTVSHNIVLVPQSFTVALWFKYTSLTAYHRIICKEYGNNRGWCIETGDTTSNIYACVWSSTQANTAYSTPATITSGDWHFLVLTYDDPTHAFAFYIDGVLQLNTHLMTGDYIPSISDLLIMPNSNAGTVSQIQMYDYALSALQVSNIYVSSYPIVGSLSGKDIVLRPKFVPPDSGNDTRLGFGITRYARWLLGWNYRAFHTVNAQSGAGSAYQKKIVAMYSTDIFRRLRFATEIGTVPTPSGKQIISAQTANYWDGTYMHIWFGASDDGTSDTDKIYYTKAVFPFTTWSTPVLVIDLTGSGQGIRDPTSYIDLRNRRVYLFCQVYTTSDGKTHPIKLYKVSMSADFTSSSSYTYVSSPIDLGTAGAYDDTMTASPCIMKKNATYYMVYEAGKNDGTYSVGLASASDIEGTWTKIDQLKDSGGSPIVNPFSTSQAVVPDMFSSTTELYTHCQRPSGGKLSIRGITGDFSGNSVALDTYDMEPQIDGYYNHNNVNELGTFNNTVYYLFQTWNNPPNVLRVYACIDCVETNAHCAPDFSDVRFTAGDGQTLLSYWKEQSVENDYAIFWVKIPDDISSNGYNMYAYYGYYFLASSLSNAKNTALSSQGDDFIDNSRDPDLWDVGRYWTDSLGVPTVTEQNARLEIAGVKSGDEAWYVSRNALDLSSCVIRDYIDDSQTQRLGQTRLWIIPTKYTNASLYDQSEWYRILNYGDGNVYIQSKAGGTLYSAARINAITVFVIKIVGNHIYFYEQNKDYPWLIYLRYDETYALSSTTAYIYLEGRQDDASNVGPSWHDAEFLRKTQSTEPINGSWGVEETTIERITNGGFETGDLTGWTNTDGLSFVSTYVNFANDAVHAGSYCLTLYGNGAQSTVSQTLSIKLANISSLGFWADDEDSTMYCVLTYSDSSTSTIYMGNSGHYWTYYDLTSYIVLKDQNLSLTQIAFVAPNSHVCGIDDVTLKTFEPNSLSIDVLLKKLGITKTDSIDVLLKKLANPVTDPIDVLFKKLAVPVSENTIAYGSIDFSNSYATAYTTGIGGSLFTNESCLCTDGTNLYEVARENGSYLAWRKGTVTGASVSWGAWTEIAGTYANLSPACTIFNGNLYIVVCGGIADIQRGDLYFGYVDLGTNVWSGWTYIGSTAFAAPELTVFPDASTLTMVVLGSDGTIYYNTYTIAGGWTGYAANTSGTLYGKFAISKLGSNLYLMGTGGGAGGSIWWGYWDGSFTWSGWTQFTAPSDGIPQNWRMCTSSYGGTDTLELFGIAAADNTIRWNRYTVVGGWAYTTSWTKLSSASSYVGCAWISPYVFLIFNYPSYLIDVLIAKRDATHTYSIDVIFSGGAVTETVSYDIDVQLKKIGLTIADSIDVLFKKLAVTATDSIDVLFKKLAIVSTYSIDVLMASRLTNIDSIDVLFKKLGLTSAYPIDVRIASTLTSTESIDVVFKKLGITVGDSIDVMFKKLGVTKTYSIDTLFKKLGLSTINSIDVLFRKTGLTATDSIDTLFKKLGVTSPYSIDVEIASRLTSTESIDTLFKKLGITATDQIDVLFKKLALTEEVQIDVVLKKIGATTADSIDVVFKKFGVTTTNQIDVLFKTLAIPVAIQIDALFATRLTATDSIDAMFKKLGVTITDSIDVLIAKLTVATFSIDVLLQKQKLTTIDSIDVLFEKLGISVGDSIDVLFKKLSVPVANQIDVLFATRLTNTDSIDVLFKKLGVTTAYSIDVLIGKFTSASYSIDVLFNKLGLTTQDSIDVLLKKLAIPVAYSTDVLIASRLTSTDLIDTLFKKTGIIVSDSIDVLFQKLGIPITESIDVLFKKFGINPQKTICVDSSPNGNSSIALGCYPPQETNWQVVSDGDDNTYVYNGDMVERKDLYTTASLNIPSNATITQITISFRGGGVVHGGYVRPRIKALSQDITEGTPVLFESKWSNASQTWTINPQTGLSWTVDEANNLYIGVGVWSDSLMGEGDCAEVYATVCYTIPFNPSIDVLFKKLSIVATDSIDTLFKKLGIVATYSIDVLVASRLTSTDSIDTLFKKTGLIVTDDIDVLLKKLAITIQDERVDVVLKKLGVTTANSIDVLFQKTGITVSDSIDVLLKALGIITTYDIDVLIAERLTSTEDIDVLLKKLGITATDSIDTLFKKLGVTNEILIDVILSKYAVTVIDQIDVLFKKQGLTVASSIDTLFKKLGITKTNLIDVQLASRLIATESIDVVLKKYGLTNAYLIDVLAALRLTTADSIDVMFKKLGMTTSDLVDVLLASRLTTMDSIDAMFKKLGLTETTQIDVLLEKLGIKAPYEIDVMLKRMNAVELYTIDAITKKLKIPVPYYLDVLFEKNAIQNAYLIDVVMVGGHHVPYDIDAIIKKYGITATDSIDTLLAKRMLAPLTQEILNGGFESEHYPYSTIPNWNIVGYAVPYNKSDNPALVHSGTWSCQVGLKMMGTFYQGEINQSFTPVEVCDIQSFGFWVIAFAGTQWVDINVGYTDRSYQDSFSTSVSTDDGWVYIDVLALIKSIGGGARLHNHANLIRIINNIGNTWQIMVDDVSLIKVGYTIDVLFQKLGIPLTVIIDTMLKKRNVTSNYSIDVLEKQLKIKKPYSIDTLVEQLGITSQYMIDVNIMKTLPKSTEYLIDMIAKELGILAPYSIDVIAKKLGVEEPYSIDAVLKKLGNEKYFSIDVILGELGIPISYVMDVIFASVMTVDYSLDVIFKQSPYRTQGYLLDVILQVAITVVSIGGGHPIEMDKPVITVRYIDRNFEFAVAPLQIVSPRQKQEVSTEELKIAKEVKSEKSISELYIAGEKSQSVAISELGVIGEAKHSKTLDELSIAKDHSQSVSVKELGVVKEQTYSAIVAELQLTKEQLVNFGIDPLSILSKKEMQFASVGLDIVSKNTLSILVEGLATKKKKLTKREILELLNQIDEMDE